MKKRYIKIISSCMLALCMTLAIAFTVLHADASESNQIQYLERIYATDNTAPETPEGYLFAGWYTDDDATTDDAVSNPELGKKYYAKFVPEEVLGIKAQISASILDGEISNKENNAIRLVTSLDSTDYKHIGFNIKKGSGEAYDAETTKKVYKTLYAVGATEATEETKLTYKANEEFHSASNYFKTWTIGKVPEDAFNTDITVTPYWITLDGTRVDGAISIKTVNLGRSWVYIDSSVNADNAGEFGTKEHPFIKLDSALDAVNLVNGKIIINENKTITVPDTFKWNGKKIKGNVRNITITGTGEKTETLDFSQVADMVIGDGVTFTNMTLIFNGNSSSNGKVHANGNPFKIDADVTSENKYTNIIGGGYNSNVDGDTSVTLLAGSYGTVYGGGRNGDVSGSTYVVIENANVCGGNTYRVFGGGYKGTVKGDTHVTIGDGFNKGLDDNFVDSTQSAVYGGGFGVENDYGIVEGNTYVVIGNSEKAEGTAKLNYVYGGGLDYSEVQKTCYITMYNGSAKSIQGGACGSGTNSHTSVVMNGGYTEQIFGGNGAGMTGNTYVEIAGGEVSRRVYGGCYNNYTIGGWQSENSVVGYTTVVVTDAEALTFDYSDKSDSSLVAGSRYTENKTGEIGVLAFCDDLYSTYQSKVGCSGTIASICSNLEPYHYLVDASEGGNVSVDKNMLSITPNTDNEGTITINDVVKHYVNGEAVCVLPEMNETTSKYDVEIVFNKLVTTTDLTAYEARIDGLYYPTFEESVEAVRLRNQKLVVTVLQDVSIDSTVVVEDTLDITIQSEQDKESEQINKYTITSTGKDLFTVDGKLEVNNIQLTTDNRAIYVTGGELLAEGLVINNAKQGIFVNGGTATVSDIKITKTTQQALQFAAKATASITDFEIVETGAAAIKVYGGADVQLTNGAINAYTYAIVTEGSEDAVSKATATNVTIDRASTTYTNELVQVGANTEFTLDGENSEIDGNYTTETPGFSGRGVVVKGTFTMDNGVIQHNNGVAGDNGGGVRVEKGATFTMNDGTIMANRVSKTSGTSYGAGILIQGTFTMNGGTICNHGSNTNALNVEGTAVCLSGDEAVFTMSGGEISSNYSSKAGAVAMRDGNDSYPQFTMNGGKITDNHTTEGVGGIVVRTGVFTMNAGAVISDNNANKAAGGMYLAAGTFNLNGGTFENNSAGTYGDDIYFAKEITLKKALTSDISISSSMAYTESKVVAVNGGISDEAFKDSMKYLVVEDKNGHWFVNEEGILTKGPVVLQTTGVGYATLAEAIEAADTGETISIVRDVEVASTIEIAKELTITSDTAVTLTASDSLTGNMFTATSGKLTIEGASETDKIRLAAGTGTQSIIDNYGGESVLTNIEIIGNDNPTSPTSARGIYNRRGTVTANSVTIQNVKYDGIGMSANTTMNLDNVEIRNVGRYGINSKGTIYVYNTINPEHALTTDTTVQHGIYLQEGGNITTVFNNVPENTYIVHIKNVTGDDKMGLYVCPGASATLSHISVKDTTGQGLYFHTASASKNAVGNISDFEVSGTGKAAVRLMNYCDVTLTNGIITVGNVEGIAVGGTTSGTTYVNTLTATNVNIYVPADRVGVKKALYYNGAVEDTHFGDNVIVSAKTDSDN